MLPCAQLRAEVLQTEGALIARPPWIGGVVFVAGIGMLVTGQNRFRRLAEGVPPWARSYQLDRARADI